MAGISSLMNARGASSTATLYSPTCALPDRVRYRQH